MLNIGSAQSIHFRGTCLLFGLRPVLVEYKVEKGYRRPSAAVGNPPAAAGIFNIQNQNLFIQRYI